MKHLITKVDTGSIAEELGLTSGCFLLDISGNSVADIIDYQDFTCSERISIRFEMTDGSLMEAEIEKDMYETLGLTFENSLMSDFRGCRNHCIFCFIDQMPKSGRDTLHFKDDDWRLSLIMGNYITLTNVDDSEFKRILERNVSPLYISVHATDGKCRERMMRNPHAVNIMQRLQALSSHGLKFHSQIVLCPKINDGEILKKTIDDLYSLHPMSRTVAVVPVGLTKHREGLFPLRPITRGEANETLDMIHSFQQRFISECGESFVYASDELYIKAGRKLPDFAAYGDFPQIENGVGLLRKFEREFIDEVSKSIPLCQKKTYTAVTGTSAYAFLSILFEQLKPKGITIELHAVENHFFGETVTVAGLLCGHDIIKALSQSVHGKTLLIPRVMLRENSDVFLDGITVKKLESVLDCKVLVLPVHDGGECARSIIEHT